MWWKSSSTQISLGFFFFVLLQTELMVVSLFVTPESGILIQDSFAMGDLHNKLIGLQVPYYYFMKKVGYLSSQEVLKSK